MSVPSLQSIDYPDLTAKVKRAILQKHSSVEVYIPYNGQTLNIPIDGTSASYQKVARIVASYVMKFKDVQMDNQTIKTTCKLSEQLARIILLREHREAILSSNELIQTYESQIEEFIESLPLDTQQAIKNYIEKKYHD
jgi:5-enolpyruvylshikimate-3-phosphate synthase